MFTLKISGGIPNPDSLFVVCVSKPWWMSAVCKNFRVQQPLGPKFSIPKKVQLGGSTWASITFLLVDQSSPIFSSIRGWNVVDQVLFWFSIYRSIPEIFAIKVESCQESRWISDIFCPSKFCRGTPCKTSVHWSPRPRTTSPGKVLWGYAHYPQVIGAHVWNFSPILNVRC